MNLKLFLSVLGLGILFMLVGKVSCGQQMEEGFNQAITSRVDRCIKYPGSDKCYSFNNQDLYSNAVNCSKTCPDQSFLYAPSNYKPSLPPRTFSGGYGQSFVGKTNSCNVGVRAVDPNDSMNLMGSGCVAKAKAKTMAVPKQQTAYSNSGMTSEPGTDLPMSNMSECPSDDYVDQPIIYERLITTPIQSRLRNGADLIRGDIPIAPCLPDLDPCSCVWMRPSVNPSVDLARSAFDILVDPCTNDKLNNLMNVSKFGSGQSSNLSTNKSVYTASSGDLTVNTSYGCAL